MYCKCTTLSTYIYLRSVCMHMCVGHLGTHANPNVLPSRPPLKPLADHHHHWQRIHFQSLKRESPAAALGLHARWQVSTHPTNACGHAVCRSSGAGPVPLAWHRPKRLGRCQPAIKAHVAPPPASWPSTQHPNSKPSLMPNERMRSHRPITSRGASCRQV